MESPVDEGNVNGGSSKPSQPGTQKRGRGMLFSGTMILLAGYAGICVLVFAMQRTVLFPRGGDIWRDPGSMGWTFDEVWLEHPEGRSHAWHIRADGPKGTIIFSHGNAGTIADRLESVEDFRWLGFDVLIYDYGGYGKSDGSPSESRCRADIRAAWDYVIEQGTSPSDIVLFGRSLGAGPTSWLATQVQPRSVIIESPFMSVGRMAQETFPYLPARWLVRDKFDNATHVPRIKSPLLVVHSREDEVIPFHHGERVFAAASGPKQFLEIHGGHNDGWYLSRTSYRAGLASFLTGIRHEKEMAR